MNVHIKRSLGASNMLRDQILSECRGYIDLILKEIDGFSLGERGRQEVAYLLAGSSGFRVGDPQDMIFDPLACPGAG